MHENNYMQSRHYGRCRTGSRDWVSVSFLVRISQVVGHGSRRRFVDSLTRSHVLWSGRANSRTWRQRDFGTRRR